MFPVSPLGMLILPAVIPLICSAALWVYVGVALFYW